ncbi:MAG: hypothetical protein V3W41_17320 [Planctomycetota bacterium]
MNRTQELKLVRRSLTVATIFVASCVVVLILVGDRFGRSQVVTDGSRTLAGNHWQDSMRFAWAERGRITKEDVVFSERAGAFDPATSDLYFARRDDSNDWDLYRARWTTQGWLDPEPLFELNSSHDELDPILVDGGQALVFASARQGGAGGLDLWRAEREGDGFGTPRNLGAALNSRDDDRHPALSPNGLRLVFASNRLAVDRTRYELFESRLSQGDWQDPDLLKALGAPEPAETRSPAFSPDGRFLFFVSDRDGGAGGFDLWRSLRFRGRWQDPVALVALNTSADELDPSLSREGNTLVFARSADETVGSPTALMLAERNEIYLLEQPGSQWWQTLLYVLAALLIALLLVWLYLRWGRLHPFIKFLIFSVILHILFLLMADPKEGYDTPPGDSGGRAFRVTFLRSESDAAAAADAATGDKVAAERLVTQAAPQAVTATENTVANAPAPSADSSRESIAARQSAASKERASELAKAAEPSRRAAQATSDLPAAAAFSNSAKRAGQDVAMNSAVQSSRATASERSESTVEGRQEAPATAANSESLSGPSASVESVARRHAGKVTGEAAPSGPFVARKSKGTSEVRIPVARSGGQPSKSAGKGHDALPPSAASEARSLELAKNNDSGQPNTSGAAPIDASSDSSAPSLQPKGRANAQRDPTGLSRDLPAGRDVAQLGPRSRAPAVGADLRALPAKLAAATAKDGSDAEWEERRLEVRELADGRRRERPAFDSKRDDTESVVAAPGLEAAGTSSALQRRSLVARDRNPSEAPARSDLPFTRARRAAPRPSMRLGDAKPKPGFVGPPRSAMPQGPVAAKSLDHARQKPDWETDSEDLRRGRQGLVRDATALLGPRDLLRRRQAILNPETKTPAVSVYANRRGVARLDALQAAGGTSETEAAVLNGLQYLKSRQRRNGAWGPRERDEKYGEIRCGKTGLALLAFLGSGHTHLSDGEFKETVAKGQKFLLSQQDKSTGHIGRGSAYSHGIATYALAEAFAMTKDASLRQPLWLAVQRIRRAQLDRNDRLDGAWTYYYRDENRGYDAWPRMSVSVWQIMALESARIGGIRVPDEVFDRARRYVVKSWDRRRKSFRYNHDPSWLQNRYAILPGSNAAAVFALQLLGEKGAEQQVRGGLQACLDRPPIGRWRKPSSDNFVRRGMGNEYYLYYATLALRMQGGDAWAYWNDRLKPLLLNNQSDNGSWKPISYYAEYARDSDRDRSYTTAMCVLMLEVYYRYDTPLLKKLAADLENKR